MATGAASCDSGTRCVVCRAGGSTTPSTATTVPGWSSSVATAAAAASGHSGAGGVACRAGGNTTPSTATIIPGSSSSVATAASTAAAASGGGVTAAPEYTTDFCDHGGHTGAQSIVPGDGGYGGSSHGGRGGHSNDTRTGSTGGVHAGSSNKSGTTSRAGCSTHWHCSGSHGFFPSCEFKTMKISNRRVYTSQYRLVA